MKQSVTVYMAYLKYGSNAVKHKLEKSESLALEWLRTEISGLVHYDVYTTAQDAAWTTMPTVSIKIEAFTTEVEVKVPAPITPNQAFINGTYRKGEYNVRLMSFGKNKIGIIRGVREVTGLSLRDAKDLVEQAPMDGDIEREDAPIVVGGVTWNDAIKIKRKVIGTDSIPTSEGAGLCVEYGGICYC